MRRSLRVLLTGAVAPAALAFACARPGRVSPDSPVDRGRAALEAERFGDARALFGQAVALDPSNPNAQLGLGAAYEGLNQLDSARAVYANLAASDVPGRVRRQLEGRMRLLVRRELVERARRAVAQEAQLAQVPPRPNTFAVFPFRYAGRRDELRPLERGLAHVFITDLAKVGELRLLERQEVQFLVEELRLAEEGRVEPATGARSGRLLQASQVVQGALSDVPGSLQLRLDASVVATVSAEVAATGSAADRLQSLFDMEKEVLFQLLERLGIQLTLAEREALAERPTANLQAFLAFSRGLEAEDRGDWARAAAEYREAERLDPSFDEAGERASDVEAMGLAAEVPLLAVTELMTPPTPPPPETFLADNLNQVIPSGMSLGQTITVAPLTPPPGTPNQFGELSGGSQVTPPGGFGTLIIVIRRPQ